MQLKIVPLAVRVAVKDVASSKLGSHHVIAEDSVKDISLEEMFQRMCKISANQKLWFQIAYCRTSVKFLVMIENFWILLKGELSKRMGIMLFLYHFMIKSWLCQTTSNKQLKD